MKTTDVLSFMLGGAWLMFIWYLVDLEADSTDRSMASESQVKQKADKLELNQVDVVLPAAENSTSNSVANKTEVVDSAKTNYAQPTSNSPDGEFSQQFLAEDPRAPKLNRTPPPKLPTREQLANPESYQAYLAGNRQRLLSAYINAVPDKVARLSALLEQGQQAGLPEQELAFAREKIEDLRQMQATLALEVTELQLTYPALEEDEGSK